MLKPRSRAQRGTSVRCGQPQSHILHVEAGAAFPCPRDLGRFSVGRAPQLWPVPQPQAALPHRHPRGPEQFWGVEEDRTAALGPMAGRVSPWPCFPAPACHTSQHTSASAETRRTSPLQGRERGRAWRSSSHQGHWGSSEHGPKRGLRRPEVCHGPAAH